MVTPGQSKFGAAPSGPAALTGVAEPPPEKKLETLPVNPPTLDDSEPVEQPPSSTTETSSATDRTALACRRMPRPRARSRSFDCGVPLLIPRPGFDVRSNISDRTVASPRRVGERVPAGTAARARVRSADRPSVAHRADGPATSH